MRREITEEQFHALEAEHGAGNVLVWSTEDGEDFAFRRYNHEDVKRALQWQADGRTDFLSKITATLLLCPLVPSAGKSIEDDLKIKGDDKVALIAERARFAELLKIPGQDDVFAVRHALHCGYGWKYEKGRTPSTILVTAKYEVGEGYSEDSWLFDVKPVEPAQYAEFRRLSMKGAPGADGRYIWDRCVQHEDKDQLAQRYAFLPCACGDQVVNMMGAKGLSLKKYGSGGHPPRP